MPEFRRGLARWLPQQAERELFHPSLEDLRAANPGWVRLHLATIALWLDCWRVWLLNPFDSRKRAPRMIRSRDRAVTAILRGSGATADSCAGTTSTRARAASKLRSSVSATAFANGFVSS